MRLRSRSGFARLLPLAALAGLAAGTVVLLASAEPARAPGVARPVGTTIEMSVPDFPREPGTPDNPRKHGMRVRGSAPVAVGGAR